MLHHVRWHYRKKTGSGKKVTFIAVLSSVNNAAFLNMMCHDTFFCVGRSKRKLSCLSCVCWCIRASLLIRVFTFQSAVKKRMNDEWMLILSQGIFDADNIETVSSFYRSAIIQMTDKGKLAQGFYSFSIGLKGNTKNTPPLSCQKSNKKPAINL